METDPVSETSYSLVFRMQDDGQGIYEVRFEFYEGKGYMVR
jgi:hypothetical protein